MTAILKRDFKAYFTSPIGYIYIGAYIFVMNLMFYFNNGLGQSASVSGVFSFMLLIMMFTTPILTMRIFSEEYKQRTDQLLLTTPVKTSGIVLGKFFSAQGVFVLLLTLTLTWPLTISFLGENNMAEVVGNYAGIFCIGAAYIAMGIFISSLTENQVVAAVGSLGLFIGLYLLELVSTYFYNSGALPVWFMSFLSFISIFGRYGSVSSGILALGDIVFFISVCALFLFLTARRWDRQRGFSILITLLFVAGVILVNVIADQLTTRFYLKLDLTEQGFYTLSSKTTETLNAIDDDITITILAEKSKWANDKRSQVVEILQLYSANSGGHIELNYVDPNLNPRIKEQFPALADVQEGDIIVQSSRRYTSVYWGELFDWEYDASYNYVPTALRAEQPLTSALLYALSDKTASVVFLEGHNESSSAALQTLFEKANYECETLNLAISELPEETTILVSAGPKSDFLPVEMERLEAYMASGGSTMIFYDTSTPSLPNLDLYLEEWGIAVESQFVLDSQYNFGTLNAIAAVVGEPESLPSLATIDTRRGYALMNGARVMTSLWPTGERLYRKSAPLAASMGSSYSKEYDPNSQLSTSEKAPEDKSGPFILGIITTESNSVTGKVSDMLVTSYSLIDEIALGNSAYFINAQVLGAIANDFNPSSSSVVIPGKALAGSNLPVLAGQARTILIVLVIAMPFMIILAGGMVWRRRRHL